MLDKNTLQSVSERDVDMLLVEELQVSCDFRKWLAQQVFESDVYKEKIGAWHSVSDVILGESDVAFLFVNNLDGRTAVLIENKIDAPPQPEQGDRYQKRGIAGQNEGWWDEFKTCVIAPQKYLESTMNTESYDCEISYEEVEGYFLERVGEDERFDHKAMVVREGILQNRRGYQPTIDPCLTRFADEYYNFATKRFPDVAMVSPKPRPSGSTWISFRPAWFPKQMDIVHQMTAGYVKLFFRGAARQFEEIQQLYCPALPSGCDVIPAGKSVALAVEVPQIAYPESKDFCECMEEAEQALSAVRDLVNTVKAITTTS